MKGGLDKPAIKYPDSKIAPPVRNLYAPNQRLAHAFNNFKDLLANYGVPDIKIYLAETNYKSREDQIQAFVKDTIKLWEAPITEIIQATKETKNVHGHLRFFIGALLVIFGGIITFDGFQVWIFFIYFTAYFLIQGSIISQFLTVEGLTGTFIAYHPVAAIWLFFGLSSILGVTTCFLIALTKNAWRYFTLSALAYTTCKFMMFLTGSVSFWEQSCIATTYAICFMFFAIYLQRKGDF